MAGESPNLGRFVTAQEAVYADALSELRRGRKTGHWMWFVFPQVDGLGSSPTSRRYAIRDVGEARAYLDHPVLGTRLAECAEAVLHRAGKSPEEIFGDTDAMKLRSSMTLFEIAAENPKPFSAVLERFYGGDRDPATLELLGTG